MCYRVGGDRDANVPSERRIVVAVELGPKYVPIHKLQGGPREPTRRIMCNAARVLAREKSGLGREARGLSPSALRPEP